MIKKRHNQRPRDRQMPKPSTRSPVHSADLLNTLHEGKSMVSTPEEERLRTLLKRAEEESPR